MIFIMKETIKTKKEKIEKLLIDTEGYKYLFKGNDLHTKDGFLAKDVIANAQLGDSLPTNKGVELSVLPVSFLDKYWKMKRGAQIIPLKDLGFIAAEVGLAPNWIIVDAGAGSGGACCFFGHLCSQGKIYTYDIRDDYLQLAAENVAFFGLKNVFLQKHNIYEGIPMKEVDFILLDVPEPWQGIEAAHAALKHGGYLVSYSPSIPQVMDFVDKIRATKGFLYLKTCEIAEKEWDVVGRKVRPRSQSIGHSGFLSFVRRL